MTPQPRQSFTPAILGNTVEYDSDAAQSIPFSKLLFDKVFAAIALVLISPVLLLVFIAVWLERDGPVIFRHSRVGMGGETFSCLKFRTMKQDAQNCLEQILDIDPIAKDEWEKTRKLYRDPRVSRLGAFLRKTSLDELPQFWNILIGDMSVVGPRPITWDETRYYASQFPVYTSVRPGLTGAWQISGRSETSYKERVDLDVNYVRQWSLPLDIHIVFKTIGVVLFCKGAF
ncbi:MAG: sugar transferase [Rhodobacteraceae bacterium]|nr:sugar transferase [Paracoccaceae bacterium]